MLATQNLSIGYGDKVIQRNLCLQANQSDLICLIGPNGAGKSTLLRSLAGLQKTLSGTITIGDKMLNALSADQRAKQIALVLTDNIEIEHFTLFDLVAMGRFPYTNWSGVLAPHDKQMIEQSLEQVNLLHKAHYHIDEVSDGEKQRAVIAKALAQDTPIVLLDEPTAHLDLPNRIEVMMLLRRLSVTMRKMFILSTHELDLAIQMADYIWLMGNGVEKAVPEDLMIRGVIQEAFRSPAFEFDDKDGHCRIHHLQGELIVTLMGNGRYYDWLKRAFVRCGITEQPHSEIVLTADNEGVVMPDGQRYNTIEQVLQWLQNNNRR